MKASQLIASELRRNHPDESGKERELSATTDGISVRVNLQDWDRLAVSLGDLTVKAVAVDAPEDEEMFISRCRQLADRLNYLEGPLKAIEVDGASRIGIIRSYPVKSRFNAKSYFEVILNGKEQSISLNRKQRSGSSGKNMPYKTVIGRHLLSRLIDDLCENISQMGTRRKK
jgi:hypothetical protein